MVDVYTVEVPRGMERDDAFHDWVRENRWAIRSCRYPTPAEVINEKRSGRMILEITNDATAVFYKLRWGDFE